MTFKMVVVRGPDETWREMVERVAKRYGLERECLQAFDHSVRHACSEDSAAWAALYAWDCIDIKHQPLTKKPEQGDD